MLTPVDESLYQASRMPDPTYMRLFELVDMKTDLDSKEWLLVMVHAATKETSLVLKLSYMGVSAELIKEQPPQERKCAQTYLRRKKALLILHNPPLLVSLIGSCARCLCTPPPCLACSFVPSRRMPSRPILSFWLVSRALHPR